MDAKGTDALLYVRYASGALGLGSGTDCAGIMRTLYSSAEAQELGGKVPRGTSLPSRYEGRWLLT